MKASRGITFIDMVVGVALAVLVFSGLFGAFRLSIEMIAISKARSGALALANEQIEYIRSLPYASVGTISGVPAGAIPQLQTISLNRTTYTRRTLVYYEDSSGDGLGAADENSIPTDYKRVKVTVAWTHRDNAEELFLASTIVPKGIETNVGGGTLRISVIDADAEPVPGALVRVFNDTAVPSIDTSVYTNANGQIALGGAPAVSNYAITVSKPTMNSAQTYAQNETNPNPSPQHLTVANALTTDSTFAIDFLAQKTLITQTPITSATTTDSFNDSSMIGFQTGTEIVGGALVLQQIAGAYSASGTVRSIGITDPSLLAWENISFTHTVPVGTTFKVFVYYDNGGTPTLVPNTSLPGNESGFTSSPITLTSLSPTLYPTLFLDAALTTTVSSETPSIAAWSISLQRAPQPIPNIAISITGTKLIGTNAASLPIYKYVQSTTTDALGVRTVLPKIEWDTYSTKLLDNNYTIAQSCPPSINEPVLPGSISTTTLTLIPHITRSLLVAARSTDGAGLAGITAVLSNGGYTQTHETSACGGAFFEMPPSGSYSLTLSSAGYTTDISTTTITGNENVSVTLIEL